MRKDRSLADGGGEDKDWEKHMRFHVSLLGARRIILGRM